MTDKPKRTRTRCFYEWPKNFPLRRASVGKMIAADSTHIACVEDKPGEPWLENDAAFRAGFWINSKSEIVLFNDPACHFWIPPGRILLLERYEEEIPDEDAPEHGEDHKSLRLG